MKSGRAVSKTSNLAGAMLSVSRVSNSSVVASIQWASSTISSTGPVSPNPTISSTNSVMVAALRCAGLSEAGTASPACAIDNSSAKSGIASASDAARRANNAPSLSIRALGESSAVKPAARDSCLITGNSELSL